MRYSQVVNFALASYVWRERYTRRKTSCARSSAAAVLRAMRYMKLTSGRRYLCTRKSKADWSPAFTFSITSASVKLSAPPIAGSKASAGRGPSDAIRTLWSMAVVLTLDGTPRGAESCPFSCSAEPSELPADDGDTGDRTGLAWSGMKGYFRHAGAATRTAAPALR